MKGDSISQLRTALTGIEEDSGEPSSIQPLKIGLVDPPSYVVHILLVSVLEFSLAKGDKSAWEVRIVFRGTRLRVRDWKRSSWSIDSFDDSIETVRVAEELERKIYSAGRLLNKLLQTELQSKVDAGKFFVKNSYRQARGGYEFFRTAVEKSLDELDVLSRTPVKMEPDPTRDKPIIMDGLTKGGITITRNSGLSDYMNKQLRLREAVSYNCSAMIGFFFSYTELLFDVLFAFDEGRSIHYMQFRGLDWVERFKAIMPVSGDSILADIYMRLLDIKRQVRDVVLHGFGGSPAILVPLGDFGLVPISYEVLDKSVHYSWLPVDDVDATAMLRVNSDFDAWVDSDDRAWYAKRYAEYLFEIPFDPERVASLKSSMTSREAFQEAIDKLAEYHDFLSDRY